MRVFPEKYEELAINRYEKQLLACIKRIYREDDVATFMLSCNPSKTKGGIVDILVLSEGILCIKVSDDINQDALMPTLFERQIQQKQELEIITSRMMLQKALVTNGKLRYAIKIVTLYPNCKKPELIDNPAMAEFNSFVENSCFFDDYFSVQVKKDRHFELIINRGSHDIITNDNLPEIINRVTPEYTIPQRKAAISEERYVEKSALLDQELSLQDRASLAYLLDDSQINYINKIKKGDQLIIACAGSGKSVILLSKCFKEYFSSAGLK